MKDDMKVGYIRVSKVSLSLKEQQAALRDAGIEDFSKTGPVYVDQPGKPKGRSEASPFRQRQLAISSLHPGDELVIASAGRLGTTTADLLEVLEAVTRAGATIYDATSGEQIVFHREILTAMAFLERAREEERRQILANARAQKAALGAHRGPPVKLTGKTLERARQAWEEVTLTVSDVVQRTGVSEATLRRRFGPKGTPRFGRAGPTSKK